MDYEQIMDRTSFGVKRGLFRLATPTTVVKYTQETKNEDGTQPAAYIIYVQRSGTRTKLENRAWRGRSSSKLMNGL